MDYYDGFYSDIINSSVDTTIIGVILAIVSAWLFLILAILIFTFIYNYKLYKKAGRQGWEAFILIYNLIVKFEFLNIPMWFIILLFIPGANVVIPIIVAINMARKFNKNSGFAVGLIFLPIIFYPILAFGKSEFDSSIKGIFEDKDSYKDDENTRYCIKCGKKVYGKYCSNCGEEIK